MLSNQSALVSCSVISACESIITTIIAHSEIKIDFTVRGRTDRRWERNSKVVHRVSKIPKLHCFSIKSNGNTESPKPFTILPCEILVISESTSQKKLKRKPHHRQQGNQRPELKGIIPTFQKIGSRRSPRRIYTVVNKVLIRKIDQFRR